MIYCRKDVKLKIKMLKFKVEALIFLLTSIITFLLRSPQTYKYDDRRTLSELDAKIYGVGWNYFNLSGFGTTVSIALLSKSGGGCLVAPSTTGEKENICQKYKSFTEGWVLFVCRFIHACVAI